MLYGAWATIVCMDQHTCMDHHMHAMLGRMHMMPSPVAHLAVRAGHECYVVGGAVRDLLLGQPPKDFDLLTSATLKEVCFRALGRAVLALQ